MMISRLFRFLSFLCSASADKEFILTFLPGKVTGSHGDIYVINPGPEVADIYMRTPLITSGPAGLNTTLTLSPGGTERIHIQQLLSLSEGFPYIEDKGIFITSDVDIYVQASSVGDFTADSFSVPPLGELGTDHVVATYRYPGATLEQGPYQIGVTGVHHNTKVTFTLGNDLGLSVLLQPYHTFLLTLPYDATVDLVGARVTSSTPVFVMSGAATSSVGAPLYLDQLTDVMPPVTKLGTTYVVTSFSGRTVGDIVRVIGVSDETNVNVTYEDGTVEHFTVRPFVYRDLLLSSDSVLVITSGDVIEVVQFMQSTFNEATNTGDCSMSVLLPVTAWSSEYYFITPTDISGATYTNYVNIVIMTSGITSELGGVSIDDVEIGDGWTPVGDYSYIRLPITPSAHVLSHTSGTVFGAVLYGNGHMESYATSLRSKQEVVTSTTTATTTADMTSTTSYGTTTVTPEVAMTTTSDMTSSPATISSSKQTTEGLMTTSTADHSVSDIPTITTQPCACVPAEWLPWEPWGACSSTCGRGVRRRTRGCHGDCGSGGKEHVMCEEGPCPKYKQKPPPEKKQFSHVDWKEADSRSTARSLSGVIIAILLTILSLIVISDVPTYVRHVRGYTRRDVIRRRRVEPLIERTRL